MMQTGDTLSLRDGRSIVIRPIRAEDKAAMAAAFERLSPESRYRRFFAPIQRLTDEELEYLTEVDHHDHEALVAVEPGTGIGLGVARFVRSADDPSVAEVAVTVVDDWQNLGVGTALLARLADRARAEGVTRFSAVVQAENRRMLELAEALGRVSYLPEGPETVLGIELPRDSGAGPQLQAALRHAASSRLTLAGQMQRVQSGARRLRAQAG